MPNQDPPRLDTLVDEYLQNGRPATRGDLESLICTLRRLNAPWITNTLAGSPKCEVEVADHVTGDMADEIARRLATLPYFQRLNHVHQLGMVPWCRNMDGCHARLSHCIGTVSWANRFLEAVERDKSVIDPARLAVLVAAFIHDAKHGPFGHSLDMLRDIFAPNIYVRLDKHLLLRALSNRASQLCAAIESVLESLEEPRETWDTIFDFIEFCLDKDAYADDPQLADDHYYLAEIVDSDLDADRMDYVFRDCRHLGCGTTPGFTDMLDVVRSVRALPVEDPETGRSVTRLCFSRKHKEKAVDRFLQLRRDLYLDYYECPEKLIADDMLAHITYYTIHGVQGVPLGRFAYSPPEEMQELVAQFMMLTDQSLVQFIYEVGGTNQRSRFALHMLNDLLRGNAFVEIGRESVPVSKAEALWKEHDLCKAAMDEREAAALAAMYGPNRGRHQKLTPDKSLEILAGALQSRSREVTLVHFVNLFSGGFHAKHCIEKLIWDRLLSDQNFQEVVRNYFFKLTGAADQERLVPFLPDIPLLHITMPTYAATSAREIEEYATEPATAKPIAYHSGDTVELLKSDLPRSQGLEKPLVLISTPRYFAERANHRAKLLEAWRECVYKDLSWARLSPDDILPTGNGRML